MELDKNGREDYRRRWNVMEASGRLPYIVV
jgi:hypothetical protein